LVKLKMISMKQCNFICYAFLVGISSINNFLVLGFAL